MLYFGYLLIQAYALPARFSQSNMANSAIIFSLVVFFIWSFIPVSGYFIAKLLPKNLKAKGNLNQLSLLVIGAGIAAIEKLFFYFNIFTYEQGFINTLSIFILCFCVAYISVDTKTKLNNDR